MPTKDSNSLDRVRETLLNEIPCIDPMCDKHGTTVGGTVDDPEPYQCQFCYEMRFPAVDKIVSLINSELQNLRSELAREIQSKAVGRKVISPRMITIYDEKFVPLDEALAIIKGGNENDERS